MSAQNTPSAMARFESVNRAFSKQSSQFDADDNANIVLQDLRQQVYRHVGNFLKPGSRVLELNAGTGIDAVYFTSLGCCVHATDLSDGMIEQINRKIQLHNLSAQLTCQQVSYEELDRVTENDFDFVFSNFGGLNCSSDLARVTKHLPNVLTPGAYVTFVIMPRICPWEFLQIFKGNAKGAFRRFHRSGVMAHLEGEYFKTYYYSLSQIKTAFGDRFTFVKSEGLASLSPPPHRGDIPLKMPKWYKALRQLDSTVKDSFPFNRWADHLVVTFQFKS